MTSTTKELTSQEKEKIKDEIKSLIEQQPAINKVNLLNSPIVTIKSFTIETAIYIYDSLCYCQSHRKLLFALAVLTASAVFLYNTPGSHQALIQKIEDQFMIGAYWLVLGVLSSIGLGTGLHTFVLYLGPFIAKVTMAAYECNTVDFETYGENSFLCPEDSTGLSPVTFWNIWTKVQFAALMWGAGTALGELPPYFVARQARLAGKKAEELAEFEEEVRDLQNEGFVEKTVNKIKLLMLSALTKFGFFGIMLFASIPNPLFDLAGLTCGHFLVPFWTFFGATFLGKAVMKAQMQASFVVTMFSKVLMDYWIQTIETLLPFLTGSIQDFIEAEKSRFHRTSVVHEQHKSILSYAWDFFLISMVGYFVLSIINSTARGYLLQQNKQKVESLQKKIQSD